MEPKKNLKRHNITTITNTTTSERYGNTSDVDPSVTNILNGVITEYTLLFGTKHDITFDYWVADLVGTIACFGDYYVDFETIRLDLERGVGYDIFFEWYDQSLSSGLIGEPIINYYTYLNNFT
jgi:hypothetical protein